MDFYNDQGTLFFKVLSGQELPGFVKEAGFDENFDVSQVPSQSFADPHRRLFPCHTPADTYLSAAYYHARKEAADAGVESSLRKFARLHGIEDEVDEARRVASAWRERQEGTKNPKTAASVAFAIESSMGTWSGEGAEALTKAAGSFVRQYANFDLEELQEVAGSFLKAAADQGAELPVDVARFAGQTAPDATLAQAAVAKRAVFLNERGERQEMSRLALDVDQEHFTPEDARKLAHVLNEFDGERGLNFHWGQKLTDPMRSVFGSAAVTEKVAGDDREVRVGGRLVKVAEFDVELGKLALGEDFTPERLLSLSPEDSQRLAQYL